MENTKSEIRHCKQSDHIKYKYGWILYIKVEIW